MDILQPSWILCLIYCFFHWSTAYAQIACPKVKLANGSVRVKGKGRMVSFKCKRNFELVGVKFAVCLSSGQWSQQIPTCVGTTCLKPDKQPNLIIEELNKGGVLKFSCGAGLTRSGPESLSCDGKKWSGEPPKCIESMTMGCDFEKEELCGWSQDTADDFDWTWNKGETPTPNTGPRFDHTTNSSEGHYLFIESSAPQKPGQKARIISPAYPPDTVKDMCLEFFYHMFGPDGVGEVGDLDVYVKPQSIKTTMLTSVRQIFHQSGNQGDQWMRADTRVPQLTEPFNFVFQATRLKSWSGDIAIDDIRLHSCLPADTAKTNAPSNTDDDDDDSEDVNNEPSPDLQTTKTQPTTVKSSTSATKRTTKQRNEQPRSTTALPRTPTTTGKASATIKASKIVTSKSRIATTTIATTRKPDDPGTNKASSAISFSASGIPSTDGVYQSQSWPHSKNNTTSDSTSATPPFTSTYISDNSGNNDNDDSKINNTRSDGMDYKDYIDIDNGKSDISSSDKIDYDSNLPDSSSGRNRSSSKNDSQAPFIDYDYNNKIGQNGATFASIDEEDDVLDGMLADTGAVKNSATHSGRIALLPLIIGVVASVIVGVTVIAILAWIWVRSQRQKEDKDQEDQMNIIAEYVETNLSV